MASIFAYCYVLHTTVKLVHSEKWQINDSVVYLPVGADLYHLCDLDLLHHFHCTGIQPANYVGRPTFPYLSSLSSTSFPSSLFLSVLSFPFLSFPFLSLPSSLSLVSVAEAQHNMPRMMHDLLTKEMVQETTN